MPRPFGLLLNIDQRMMDTFENNLRNRTNVGFIDFDPQPDGTVNALALFPTFEERNAGTFVVKNLGSSRNSKIIKLPEAIPADIRRK